MRGVDGRARPVTTPPGSGTGGRRAAATAAAWPPPPPPPPPLRPLLAPAAWAWACGLLGGRGLAGGGRLGLALHPLVGLAGPALLLLLDQLAELGLGLGAGLDVLGLLLLGGLLGLVDLLGLGGRLRCGCPRACARSAVEVGDGLVELVGRRRAGARGRRGRAGRAAGRR